MSTAVAVVSAALTVVGAVSMVVSAAVAGVRHWKAKNSSSPE
jgi:hypothetical protein